MESVDRLDLLLAQYLDSELDREDAIERVGRTTVERAEWERGCRGRRRLGPERVTLVTVSDAGPLPLIHLGKIDSLELLSAFNTLLISEAVYDEIERGGVLDGFSGLSYELVEADENGIESEVVGRRRTRRVSGHKRTRGSSSDGRPRRARGRVTHTSTPFSSNSMVAHVRLHTPLASDRIGRRYRGSTWSNASPVSSPAATNSSGSNGRASLRHCS